MRKVHTMAYNSIADEPTVTSWHYLAERKDKFGMSSMPKNPQCKLCTEGCSEAIKGDLCFWHHHRIAKVREYQCACPGKLWKTLVGDGTGRFLASEYYQNDDLYKVDTASNFYCSHAGDYHSYECGNLRLCSECKNDHPGCDNINNLPSGGDQWTVEDPVEDHSEDHSVWPSHSEYAYQLSQRMLNGQRYLVAVMTATGPTFSIPDVSFGGLKVNSALSALIAAGRNPKDAEWWVWIAGWYDDCPPGVTRHV